MLALVERPVHAQPVVWAPSLPQRGRRLAVRAKIVQPVSFRIRVLNQGAKTVEQGGIILEQGELLAACVLPVAQEPTRPQRGRRLAVRVKIVHLDSTAIKQHNQVARTV